MTHLILRVIVLAASIVLSKLPVCLRAQRDKDCRLQNACAGLKR